MSTCQTFSSFLLHAVDSTLNFVKHWAIYTKNSGTLGLAITLSLRNSFIEFKGRPQYGVSSRSPGLNGPEFHEFFSHFLSPEVLSLKLICI